MEALRHVINDTTDHSVAARKTTDASPVDVVETDVSVVVRDGNHIERRGHGNPVAITSLTFKSIQ